MTKCKQCPLKEECKQSLSNKCPPCSSIKEKFDLDFNDPTITLLKRCAHLLKNNQEIYPYTLLSEDILRWEQQL